MYPVEMYVQVRRAVYREGLSQREAAKRFGLNRRTVAKMLEHAVPPGYQRNQVPTQPVLDPFKPVIDQWLEQDRTVPKKQRHTAVRIFDRLQREHGYTGSYSTVRIYVREQRLGGQEVFIPLAHPPGHAQVDFGEALGIIAGQQCKLHCFCLYLPYSDACFVKAYPAEISEAFCDGHTSAFAFFAAVPLSILYDNTKLAVAKILGHGRRQRTRIFSELQSHYLFEDRFGRPGKGNDKGGVEGLVGYSRRNFLVPMPEFDDFDQLNAHLEACCLERLNDIVRGDERSIGERLLDDLNAMSVQPATPYDACDKQAREVNSLALVRYRDVDYSVPTAYAYRGVLVRGYIHEVVISYRDEVIARHRRSYQRQDMVFDPLHYLPLLERKPRALDQAAPLQNWSIAGSILNFTSIIRSPSGYTR